MTNDEKREAAKIVLSSDVKTLLSPEMTNTLDRWDKSADKTKEAALAVKDTVQAVGQVVDNVTVIWNCTMDTIKAVRELDVIMKEMDISLEMFLKNADVNLEKFKQNAGIVERQLDKISDRIDNVLNKAFTIDSKTCEDVDLELRNKLITQVRDWSDHISSLLMKLMGV